MRRRERGYPRAKKGELTTFRAIFATVGIVCGGIVASVCLAVGDENIVRSIPVSAPPPATVSTRASSVGVHFTRGTATAKKFGTHEVVLSGDGAVANPFHTTATVTFTPPSGQAITVDTFYDGENIWRARVYVTETGTWQWLSVSSDDAGLHNKRGAFTAVDSDLRGMLRKHDRNPKQWMTDDGQPFLNLSDTVYPFFNSEQARWQEYIQDSVALGITSMRVDSLRAPSAWENYWEDGDKTRYKLENFQTMDVRLQWVLDHYPDLYIQLKLLHAPATYGADDPFWSELPQTVRQNLMRYLIARLAAYPNLFFEVTNDTRCSTDYPLNRAMAREVGRYFTAHDPWQHLLSYGPTRGEGFCFTEPEDEWVSYIAIETAAALSADQVQLYTDLPLHVFNEEDYYEAWAVSPAHPRYYYRRFFWSWLLSGGSPNYGGRCLAVHPYTQTGALSWDYGGQTFTEQLEGLDSVRYIPAYFAARGIELWQFQPDDTIVSDVDGESELKNYLLSVADWSLRILKNPRTIHEIRGSGLATYPAEWFFSTFKRSAFGSARPKAARRGHEEYLIYHPNAKSGEMSGSGQAMINSRLNADVDPNSTARMRVDLRESAGITFRVEWFRAHDGRTQNDSPREGGAYQDFVAPWKGYDVVLRLVSVTENARVP